MTAALGAIQNALWSTSDAESNRILAESIHTLCGNSSAAVPDATGQYSLVVPWLLGDAVRKFFLDHRQFIIDLCLNNELNECVSRIQGQASNGTVTSDLNLNSGRNFNFVTDLFRNSEVIPLSPAVLLEDEHSTEAQNGTETLQIEEGGEPSIAPTGKSEAQVARKEKKKRRKVNRKAGAAQRQTGKFAGARDDDTEHHAESTNPEVRLQEEGKGQPVAEGIAAVIDALEEDNAEEAVSKFPEFITAPDDATAYHPVLSLVAVAAEEVGRAHQSGVAIPKAAGVQDVPSHGVSASVTNSDRARVIAELRAQPPPPSMAEARAHRASIKQERRANIDFIRSRTTSRASGGSPSPLSFSPIPPASPALPQAVEQPAGPPIGDVVGGEREVEPSSLVQLESTGASETGRAPKRGKWVAPLPEDQEWRVISPAPVRSVAPAAPSAPKKKGKGRGAAKSGASSKKSSALPTDIGLVPTSEVGIPIAESFGSESNPEPSCEDEIVGHGNTEPTPSVTSRVKSIRPQSEDEPKLTESIVEDSGSALADQSCVEVERAKGTLTRAAPSTTHNLITELMGAGVSPSALSSFGDGSSLKTYETPGHQLPVAVVRVLEFETVTIDGIAFATPRGCCRVHRRTRSMPELFDRDARSEMSESVVDIDDSVISDAAGSVNPENGSSGSGTASSNAIVDPVLNVSSVGHPLESSTQLPIRQSPEVSSLELGSPVMAAPIASPAAATFPSAVVVVRSVRSSELVQDEELVASYLFKEPAQDFETRLPGHLSWNGKLMTSAEVASALGPRLPRPLTLQDHRAVNEFLRARINCAYCGSLTSESFEEGPERTQSLACPGCGPASEVRYCDEGCLLADALNHAKVCGTGSPTSVVFWVRMPQRYHKMVPFLRPVTGVSVSAECHRQMAFSMLAHNKPTRNPVWTWAAQNLTLEERGEMFIPKMVERGDYFLFAHSTLIPDCFPMVCEVISFPPGIERATFNRALNAALYTRQSSIVSFIHRMLFDAVASMPGGLLSARAKKVLLSRQLQQEFPEAGEFVCQKDKFEFASEWKEIESDVLHLECIHPLLRAWCRDDPAREWTGQRKSSVWTRFGGTMWGDVEDPDFVEGLPVPNGILPAGYYGVEPSVYEPELNDKYRNLVLAALKKAEEEGKGDKAE